jgi:glycosyltransferase involved in cell wall biosynthesis
MWGKIIQLFRIKKNLKITDISFIDSAKKTILVIDDDIPQYDKSSGSRRLFELIKIFKSLNLNVIFLPNDGVAVEPYYSVLKNLDVEVLLSDPNRNAMLKKLDLLLPFIDYSWISRPSLNKKFQRKIKKNPDIKIIYDTVDLHYIRELRQAEKEDDKKQKHQAEKTKKLELKSAINADFTVTVTETEKNILNSENIKNVFVIPNIHEPKYQINIKSFEERNGLLFIGGYKHEPNIDAVKWLINEIMPLVWAKIGPVPVYLLGSHPSQEVTALANDIVFVPGFLENVDSYFENCRVFTAPLRYGAGMKGKIGQSLEYHLPIVTTDIGAEGMDLTNEKNILIANQTEEFAEQIVKLYQDPILWSNIQKNASKAIANYNADAVKNKLSELFKTLDQN